MTVTFGEAVVNVSSGETVVNGDDEVTVPDTKSELEPFKL